MRFRAAILEGVGAPLAVDEVESGEPGVGEVLVRVLASGICGAQLQEIRGEKGNQDNMPHLLGHEGCGIVEQVGVGVSRVKRGDKVVMHWRKAGGIEGDFPWYKRPGAEDFMVGGGKVTTLTEYSICSENRLTPVPPDTPKELAAMMGCGLSTALGIFENEAQVKYGQSVLVVGVGGLGCNLIRCACFAHAHPVVAMDVHESKRKMALALGADSYVCAKAGKDIGKFDLIIDTAGAGGSMESTLPLLAPSGRFLMVGQPRPGEAVPIVGARHLFDGEGKTIHATQGGGFIPDRDIPRWVGLHRAGKLNTDGIITHRLPLERVNEGIELVKAGHAGRVLIDMELKNEVRHSQGISRVRGTNRKSVGGRRSAVPAASVGRK